MSAAPTAASGLAEVLDGTHVAVVCGTGGVGKTSVAAALAAAEAMRGRRVCVLTIDPARRLAQALGLERLDDQLRPITLPASAAPGGALTAAMLDPQRTFDRLVEETAPDPESRDRIFDNSLYRELTRHAASVQEYMALERLYEIDRAGDFDLIVVDTPPMAHARDLLDAPQRILEFLNGRSLRWFLKPSLRMGRVGLRAVGGARGLLVQGLSRLTGAEALQDVSEFFEAFEGMYDLFGERVQVVERLLAEESTGFLVVTSPERESLTGAAEFWLSLADQGLGFIGTVVNRVEPEWPGRLRRAQDLQELGEIPDDLARRLARCLRDHQDVARRDAERIALLRDQTMGSPVASAPRMPRLEASLDGLLGLALHLYAGDA